MRPAAERSLGDDDVPNVGSVWIADEPYAGPFWEGGVHISNSFDELSEWIGISRELFERIMTWHKDFNANSVPPAGVRYREDWIAEKQRRRSELTAALRAEIGNRIRVDDGPQK